MGGKLNKEDLDLKGLAEVGINIDDIDDADYDEIVEGEKKEAENTLVALENQIGPLPDSSGDFLDLQPLYDRKKETSGKYRLDTKVEAIVNLSISLKVDELELNIQPNYAEVAQYLGIPAATLRSWWDKRDAIIEKGDRFIQQLNRIATLKNTLQILRIQESMNDRDWNEESLKDVITAMKTFVIMNKVLTQETGVDKHVKHTHHIMPVQPEKK